MKEKLQRLLQEQLLKDPAFKDSIEGKIQETDILTMSSMQSWTIDWGSLSKEIIEKLK